MDNSRHGSREISARKIVAKSNRRCHGVGLRYAANMIEKYAEISVSESKAILELLAKAEHAPDAEVYPPGGPQQSRELSNCFEMEAGNVIGHGYTDLQ